MSLQGPRWPACVRGRLVVRLRRPCRVAAVLASLATASLPTVGAAACHKYSVWRFNYPQRCSRTFQPKQAVAFPLPPERPVTSQEKTGFPPPPLIFEASQDGDDHLRALALLRALYDAR